MEFIYQVSLLLCNISKEMGYSMAGFLCSCFSIRLKCTIWYLETTILKDSVIVIKEF